MTISPRIAPFLCSSRGLRINQNRPRFSSETVIKSYYRGTTHFGRTPSFACTDFCMVSLQDTAKQTSETYAHPCGTAVRQRTGFCHTLLIDNGFGSRRLLLCSSAFRTAFESPFGKPLHTAFPPSAALWYVANMLTTLSHRFLPLSTYSVASGYKFVNR